MPLNDRIVLEELAKLVRETFLLWDDVWVGFSWRHYFFEHTQRVRALSLEIGRREGANLRKLEYAALLHDITKRYDGNILKDNQGKRLLDQNGFWRNELLMPKKENPITKMYQDYNQFHELHNLSGALIAKKILESQNFSADFCASVGSIIEGHLKPEPMGGEGLPNLLERRILYESDTIDANLGLIAVYRNIHIHTHSMIAEKGSIDLRQYIDRMKTWINTKTPFIERMTTETSIKIAKERRERMEEFCQRIVEERDNDYLAGTEYGMLGVIKYLIDCNVNPNLLDEISYLQNYWIPQRNGKLNQSPKSEEILRNAVDFCRLLSQEIEGKA
ncbi:MAG: hypothetical protein QG670_2339 [Thermoproteota archaeon]|nr:hypothetical protein [Thermoproteota archaeon]